MEEIYALKDKPVYSKIYKKETNLSSIFYDAHIEGVSNEDTIWCSRWQP